jgi:hypothetical protein
MGRNKTTNNDLLSADKLNELKAKTLSKKPSSGLIKLSVIVLCLILFIPLFIFGRHYMINHVLPTPQRVVASYFKNIAKEDYSKAFELLKDPFKASKGENVEEFASMFDLSRRHGTVYRHAKVLMVSDTNRKSVKLVSFELHIREKGRLTVATGAYYVERDLQTKQWFIVDSAQ